MIKRIPASVPLVWRTPRTLQFGVDEALVVLEGVDTATERIVAALQSGVDSRLSDRLAGMVGTTLAQAASVIAALDPVIESAPDRSDGTRNGRTIARRARVVVDGDGPTAGRLRALLGPHVDLVDRGDEAVDVAVLTAHYVIRPSRYARWLRDDVPHLPIVFGDRVARVGPFVVPGSSPCLYCLDRAHVDADPAWPAIASQLLARTSPIETALVSAECATRVARILLDPSGASAHALRSSQVVIAAETGVVTLNGVRPHSRCACRSLPGTETDPDDRRAIATPTRTG